MAVIYSDLNSLYPSRSPQLQNVESVYQSLFNIFNTTPGERLFLPEFGLDLETTLFELLDDATSLEIYRRVVSAVTRWESRVKIDASRTEVIANSDEHRYDLDLYFEIQGVDDQTFRFQGSFTA